MIAISLTPVKVILDTDKDLKKAEQVEYMIKPLSAKKMFEYQAYVDSTKENPDQFGQIEKLIEAGLVGWNNLKDGSGNEISFPATASEVLDVLDIGTASAIVEKIMELSTPFVGKQEKN